VADSRCQLALRCRPLSMTAVNKTAGLQANNERRCHQCQSRTSELPLARELAG
jgi:hypothetical protein